VAGSPDRASPGTEGLSTLRLLVSLWHGQQPCHNELSQIKSDPSCNSRPHRLGGDVVCSRGLVGSEIVIHQNEELMKL